MYLSPKKSSYTYSIPQRVAVMKEGLNPKP